MNFKILTRADDGKKIPVNLELVRYIDPFEKWTILIFDGSTDRGQSLERGEFDTEPIEVVRADYVVVTETVDEILIP